MSKFALVFFPKIANDALDDFREKYDPEYKKIAPHITLLYPLPEIAMADLMFHLQTISSSTKSFPIKIGGLKKMDDCLFLLVDEGNEKIITLKDHLSSGILSSYIPEHLPFAPHLTIGNFRSLYDEIDTQSFENAHNEAKEFNFKFSCQLDSIALLEGDVSTSKILQTFEFQK